MFSFFLDIYLEVELLGEMVTLYLIVWGTARLLSRLCTAFHNPSSVWGFQFVHMLTNTYFLGFWF